MVAEVPVDLSCNNVFSNYTPEYRELLMTVTSLGMEYVLSEYVECTTQENFNCRIALNWVMSNVLCSMLGYIFFDQYLH